MSRDLKYMTGLWFYSCVQRGHSRNERWHGKKKKGKLLSVAGISDKEETWRRWFAIAQKEHE